MEGFAYIQQIHEWNTNFAMEPARIVCPCFGGRPPVVIYDLTIGVAHSVNTCILRTPYKSCAKMVVDLTQSRFSN